jgi:hypothetical protein
MTCRSCGTDIAAKALICYKCGAATTDPVFQPPSGGRPRSNVAFTVTFSALVLLVLAAVILSRISPGSAPPWVTWVVGAVAIVIVALRAYARRR